jgi:hypothetical protein
MNARERFAAIMAFERPDRGLLWEMGYWNETLERWYGEGLVRRRGLRKEFVPGEGVRGESVPHDVTSTAKVRDADAHEQLGLDAALVTLPVNAGTQPAFAAVVIDETEDLRIVQDELGVRKAFNKKSPSVPRYLSFPVACRDDFEKLKAERFPRELADRVPRDWAARVSAYGQRDYPLAVGGLPYGFFGFLRLLMGEEKLFVGFYDQPDLLRDILTFMTDLWIDLWEQALSATTVDCAHFWEDMAYRNASLISPALFRAFIMPCYRKITSFLRARGVSTVLVDTDGNLDELIPLFLESGVTGLYPIEVQAGNDAVAIRRRYPRLQMMGGIDKKKVALGRQAIDRELAQVPFLLGSGGYIAHLDHLAPPDVSWSDFCYYRDALRRIV